MSTTKIQPRQLSITAGSGITLSSGSISLAAGTEQRVILYDITLSGSGTFLFDSLSGYTDLEITGTLRSNSNDTNAILWEFNDDKTDGNYVIITYYYGAASGNAVSNTRNFGYTSEANSTANHFGIFRGLLMNYLSSTQFKIMLGDGGSTRSGASYGTTGQFYWKSTDPITKIEVFSGSEGVFAAGSRMKVVGIKTV